MLVAVSSSKVYIAMYCTFYQLFENPFKPTPDPRFLFLTPEHREALSSMLYMIRERRGFAAITGDVGTGKTMLVHYLLNALGGRVQTAFIFHTYVSFVQLVQKIFIDLCIPLATDNKVFLVDRLNRYLVERLAEGEIVAVVIDEAHNLSNCVLEELRMLSNLETPRAKLLQILLVGQPELEEKLNSHELRQLKQRIGIRRKIKPLTAAECAKYIDYRLRIVGSSASRVFTSGALALIFERSEGVPRGINMLCDNALLTGYAVRKAVVDEQIVQEVIHDMKSTDAITSVSAAAVDAEENISRRRLGRLQRLLKTLMKRRL